MLPFYFSDTNLLSAIEHAKLKNRRIREQERFNDETHRRYDSIYAGDHLRSGRGGLSVHHLSRLQAQSNRTRPQPLTHTHTHPNPPPRPVKGHSWESEVSPNQHIHRWMSPPPDHPGDHRRLNENSHRGLPGRKLPRPPLMRPSPMDIPVEFEDTRRPDFSSYLPERRFPRAPNARQSSRESRRYLPQEPVETVIYAGRTMDFTESESETEDDVGWP